MHPFAAYLREHHLEALSVSVSAHVRYLTVYNATRGIPITREHARNIRQAVLSMTGRPFVDEFVLTDSASVVDAPTIRMKKLPRHV